MKQTTSDVLLEILCDWGVDTIFGIPGDGINGIMEALRRKKDKIRFIQVRHEESAAFMACSYSKFTGRLGVCLATSGPGGIHLLNGLYDAKLDGQSVLAITGMPFHDLINTHTQQDVELDKLYVDVAKYNARVMGPAHIENVAHLACRTALSYHGVSHITIPVDVQDQEVKNKKKSKRNVPGHAAALQRNGVKHPNQESIHNAANILNAAKRPVILAGRGALGAREVLLQTAEKLGAPIVKPLLGKAAVPDDHPLTTGGIGLLGTEPSQSAMEECDVLLMVGTSFPYIEYFPKPDQARCVQIEVDPMKAGLRYPVDVPLIGDSRVILEDLLPLLKANNNREFLEKIQKKMGEWNETMKARGTCQDMPMKPQVVAWELCGRLEDDAIVVSDSGTIATWFARHIMAKKDQMYSLSGNLATMANGLPYAAAAQIAHPNRQCVAFVGDGGFSMLMADFVTCVKYQLPVKIIIIKNNTLGQIKWEQMVFLGNPEYGCDLHPIDFVKFAEACGGKGYRIEDPKKCGKILDQALGEKGPVVVEALVDPFEPPMPPKVSFDQAKKFASSLARGEPNREKIALTVLSDKVREMI